MSRLTTRVPTRTQMPFTEKEKMSERERKRKKEVEKEKANNIFAFLF